MISAAYVDEGPTLKRWRARARGRVSRILKRTCHITIKLELPEAVAAGGEKGSGRKRPKRSRKPATGGASAGGAAAAKPKRSKRKAAV